jgi:hypothetical protein
MASVDIIQYLVLYIVTMVKCVGFNTLFLAHFFLVGSSLLACSR